MYLFRGGGGGGKEGRGYLKVKVAFFFPGVLRWHCCATAWVFITALSAPVLSSGEGNYSVSSEAIR